MLYLVSRMVQVYVLPPVLMFGVYDFGTTSMVQCARMVSVGLLLGIVVGHLCARVRDTQSVGPTLAFIMLLFCGFYRLGFCYWVSVLGCAWYFWRWRPQSADQNMETASEK